MNRTKFLIGMGLFLSAALLLSACSRLTTVGGEPVLFGFSVDYQPANIERHPSTSRQQQPANEPERQQAIQIDGVTVHTEAGSSTPVRVKISGAWPGLCSQLAEIKQTFDGESFDIRLSGTSDRSACSSDQPGLSFWIDLPLNMAEKAAGTYIVRVNGKEHSFEWSD